MSGTTEELTPVTVAPALPESASRSPRWRHWRSLMAVGMVAGIATFVLGVVALTSYQRVSPIDELQHLDGVVKASNGQWVLQPGERVGQEAMRLEACHGIDAAFTPPACDAPIFAPEAFQELGINTAADGTPSPYTVVTGTGVRLLGWTGLDALESGRLLSLLAHALGAAFVAVLAAIVSRSAVTGAAGGVAVGSLAPVLSQGVSVNPDSWALLVGASFCALALRGHRLAAGVFAALVVGLTLGATLIKINWFLLALLPIGYSAIGWLARRDRAALVRTFVAVLGTAAAFLLFYGSTYLAGRLATPVPGTAPMNTNLAMSASNPWDWSAVVESTLGSTVVTGHPPVVDPLEHLVTTRLGILWGTFLFGAAVVCVLTRRAASPAFRFGLIALVLLLASPAFVYFGQYIGDSFWAYPQRYSFMILPALVVAMSALRPRPWLLASAAALTWVVVLAATLQANAVLAT